MRLSIIMFFMFFLLGYPLSLKAAESEGIEAQIVKTRTVLEGRRAPVVLSLQHKESGAPVMLNQLDVVHTEPIHLLIVDPSLTDYHHLHPTEGRVAGEYHFILKPNTSCGYRVWVDITPVGSMQQYARADIPGIEDCRNVVVDKTMNMTYEGNGYRYELSLDQPLRKGNDTMATITVRDDAGLLFDELEPVMGAYAHMVGFFEDYETIAHMHPMGKEPESWEDRGGPTLTFHINPENSGYMKLYAQFYIDGRDHFVPFGVEVSE